MTNPAHVVEKRFAKETHRAIGEVQLHRYGNVLEQYHGRIKSYRTKLNCLYSINAKPITIQVTPKENVSTLQLVHSDNKLLSRILVSLASVCNEIDLLVAEANENFYPQLVYYGEIEEGEANYKQLGDLLKLLQSIHSFVSRSQQVINLILQQMCAILGKGLFLASTSTFPEPFDCLASLLVCLITLEYLLTSDVIKEHWNIYKRAVTSFMHNPKNFNMTRESLKSLNKKMAEFEVDLLSGNILQAVMEKSLTENVFTAVKNCNLPNEILLFLQYLLSELERDDDNVFFTQIWMQANALFVLYHHTHGGTDKKVLKRILEVNKKISACTVSGNVMWYPEKFLIKLFPVLVKQIDVKSIAAARKTQVAQRSQNLSKETHSLCMQACYWTIEACKISSEDMSRYKIKQLQDTCNLLVDGLKLVKKISELIKWITNLHADESRPMPKSVLLALCKLVEVLKSFEFVFHRNVLPISYVVLLISQHLTHKALANLANVKKSFTQEKNYKDQQLDVLSALVVAERALKGPNTRERLLVAKLALSASGSSHSSITDIRDVINKIELVCNVSKLLQSLCNCSFLYWHQVMFPIYFTKLIESRSDLASSHLLLSALSDCTGVGANVKPNIQKSLKLNLLEPLNQAVESNLRLQTHLHLHLTPINPFQTILPQTFHKIYPVLFSDEYVNIKQEVEHYLSTMFYNLTTVVLHDWKTYGEMRRLALLQYGLHTVEDNLPVQTLEQGLDVLEIMRNINVFVAKYQYNLNNQVFVEEWSSNKHLNTINISHVANSIRTHGIGIMSTTVNFTYQFLRNKFFTFSQFLFDEHIKSRLLKDLRFFNEHKSELNQLYPYVRAEKFNYGIRNLGLNENGLSFLDQFRKLVTQIGNAMGYVRLIRSGGKRCVAEATCFLPDFKAVHELNELIENADLPELTRKAADSLKRDITNLVDNFEEATEYFKLLTNVFAPLFRDPQNIHLRNFYMIIPPLTLNFVEYSLTCKERINKKNKTGCSFTDDGFAMGLAFTIELLDQVSQLNSIHWFQSVDMKITQELQDLDRQKLQASKDDIKLQQTLTLTEKRIHSLGEEFKLLYYNFSSARIFFQT